ncbi:hypothetical protein KSC_035000 [Ktedonobacter sp. SOSP1-52]|nr:hypothetical protein KSC_035000 [Ktedonobacter sp. SOSP1-52]
MFWIWYQLLSGPKRFGELQKLLPSISQQVLTLELRELEQMGVLQRQASELRLTTREYALTKLGRNSEPILRQLYAWGRWICERLGLEYDWPMMNEAEVRASRISSRIGETIHPQCAKISPIFGLLAFEIAKTDGA